VDTREIFKRVFYSSYNCMRQVYSSIELYRVWRVVTWDVAVGLSTSETSMEVTKRISQRSRHNWKGNL